MRKTVFFSESESNAGLPSKEKCNYSNLAVEISHWAMEFDISQNAQARHLSILHAHHPPLPEHQRTVVKTPQKTVIKVVDGGSYFHLLLVVCMAASTIRNGCTSQDITTKLLDSEK